jgi:hypothetical protein
MLKFLKGRLNYPGYCSQGFWVMPCLNEQ